MVWCTVKHFKSKGILKEVEECGTHYRVSGDEGHVDGLFVDLSGMFNMFCLSKCAHQICTSYNNYLFVYRTQSNTKWWITKW